MLKFDLAWWVKVELGDVIPSVADMRKCPGNIVLPHNVKKGSRQWIWMPSVNGQIKVNMDGSYLERSGRGGLFRYAEGRILVQYGNEVTVDSMVHAKFLVFR